MISMKALVCLAGAALGLYSQINWLISHGWEILGPVRLAGGMLAGWLLPWAVLRFIERRRGLAPAPALPDLPAIWATRTCKVVLTLAAAAGLTTGAAIYLGQKPTLQDDKTLVGAAYYLWYPDNFLHGFLREELDPPQAPALGFYNSKNPKVIEQHIAWCTRFGINFLALDWWPGRPEQNRIINDVFLNAPNISDIKFCIFYEAWDLNWQPARGGTVFDQKTIDRLEKDVTRIAGLFFSHPSYLKVDGRPVIFFYLTRTFLGQYREAFTGLRKKIQEMGYDPFFIADEVYWEVLAARGGKDGGRPPLSRAPQMERIRLFDAITAYNMYLPGPHHHFGYGGANHFLDGVEIEYNKYSAACAEDFYFVPGIIPGYNDRGARLREDHHALPRRWLPGGKEGSFLSRMYEWVGEPFIDPKLNMLFITSFNEWNEDTSIEPLAPAPAVTKDQSPIGYDYTEGYSYAGYGTTYLETVRDKTIAISGRVLDVKGRPQSMAEVCAEKWYWPQPRCGLSDSRGYYTISRLGLPPDEYRVEASGGQKSRDVTVEPGRTAAKVDFVVDSKQR